MDYKNILEGTRQFFQGLPMSHSSPPAAPPSVTPPQTDKLLAQSPHPQSHHHLLGNYNQNHSQSITPPLGSGGNKSNNNNHHPTVITPNTNVSPPRSGSLERLGHSPISSLHRSGSVSSLHNNHHMSQTTKLPLALPQDGEALIRSKFAEGLGATLSQMYAGVGGGHNNPHHQQNSYAQANSTLALSRASIQHNSAATALLMLDRERIHSTTNAAASSSSIIVKSPHQSPSKLLGSTNSNSSISTNASVGGAKSNAGAPPTMVGVVRRESPLDLSVKTVRQSADSSTSSEQQQASVIMGMTSATTNGATKSGSSTPIPNSTTNNLDLSHAKRGRSKEKESSRTSTPNNQRYPSPQQRQQSPSSSSSAPPPLMHQRLANLNQSIPNNHAAPPPQQPPRTGSGSSVASSNAGVHLPQMQMVQQNPQQLPQHQPMQNHHLLSHYPQASPNGRMSATPQQAPVYHHHYASSLPATPIPQASVQGSQPQPIIGSTAQTPTPTSRPSSVIPPYNPPLGGLSASYPHHPHPGASPYHPQLPPGYPSYHPHFSSQQQQAHPQQQHAAYYSNYPPPPQHQQTAPPQQQQQPPKSSAPSSQQQQQPPQVSSPAGHYAPQQPQKLSHSSNYPQQSQPPPAPPQSPYYHHAQHYYGAPPPSQVQPQVQRPAPPPPQHISYPTYGQTPSTIGQAPTPYPHPHYSPHISYPTYLPSNQRNAPVQPPPQQQPPQQQAAYASSPQTPTNFQPHPGLRPTTPTGPPPPLNNSHYHQPPPPQQHQQNQSPYQPIPPPQQQPPINASIPSNNEKASPNTTPMKPPQKQKGGSRKNVLNMLRNSVESRMHEKQEKEKFQFNSHQTWNFHGRKFNTSLPPQPHPHSQGGSTGNSAYSSNSSTPSYLSKSSILSKYESGAGTGSDISQFGNMADLDPASLQRIRTKAEKKQLFPNLLSQIEQENSTKERNAHFRGSNSASVFDFREDEDELGSGASKIIIPHPPPPIMAGALMKKPRSPKKVDGAGRRASSSSGGKKKNSLLDGGNIGHDFSTADSIPATKAVTKLAAEGSIDAFWAACDSFLDDLQSNPNSIKSRRGGLWQKLKPKKPETAPTGATPSTTNATSAPISKSPKVSRGARVRKNSTEEDSDFQVEEKSEEEEEDNSDSEDEDDSDKDSDNSGGSSTSLRRGKRKRSKLDDKEKDVDSPSRKKRRVINSEDENEPSTKENEDDDENEEGTKTKKEVSEKKGRTGKKKSSEDEDDDDDDDEEKGRKRGKRNDRKSKRRSTRKRRAVVRSSRQLLTELDDDEDATSRTSIGSEESESDSESYGYSSNSSNSSANSSNSEDDDESEDSEGGKKNKKGRRRKEEKRSKRLRTSTRSKRRKGGDRSTSSGEEDKKGKKDRKNDDEDDDGDENFEPKGITIKHRGKGRKRKLPKRNCAPNGKLKDISGESGNEEAHVGGVGGGGSSGEEWIMRGDLTKKKRKVVFGDGSDFKRPGWEEEQIDFKRKLRMPQKLIRVAKPSSMSLMSSADSLSEEKLPPPTNLDANKSLSTKENKVPAPIIAKPFGKKTPVKTESKLATPNTTPNKKPLISEEDKPQKGKGRQVKSASESPSPANKKVKKGSKASATLTTVSESESPLDEPTIEKAVERMKAAANNANAKLAAQLKDKAKPILSKANSTPLPNKKGKEKNSSSLDDLPVLSPQTMIIPEDVENFKDSPVPAAITTPIAPTPPIKKGFRRNKFKSGFDYIRKKKKVEKNPDGSPLAPTPKKIKIIIEKNTTIEDVATEIRGWVLNKGHGETALHRAARLGYPDVAAYCLEHEMCIPNCKDNAGYTPLHETCIKGNLDVAKVLLQYGADPSQSAPGGIRPLHEACENGHVELVRLLISFGADPTLTTYAGQSPLELAEPHEPVRLLLDQHINDVIGAKEIAWEFKGSGGWVEDLHEIGFDVTADPPPCDSEEPDIDDFEFEASETPLPPLYKLKEKAPYYVLLNDVLNYLGVGRDKFLKSHPTVETVELNSNDFLDEAHCCHLLGEKFNLNSSSDLLTLIKYDERVKKMLNIESCFIK